ncbi:uncharacterized protein AMSG_09989 [Thecamonas trahens ATCC 50062]|uniref:Uncharacterized protein n=1 Tax=Thecamonas trahens ATCC 50062 TaxID=461836 RepID=A0A0L0DPL6_THETB|nr:hypothetical protein AMSG_09989 [Thecamonas trahens ATCC 50062]KNC54200.1 hypothetical protein AMSG_09989 [Thecamonas trahens ATCC 50062]|eukprot:XP_013753840.1 hypothetical protein AMSG_09989 [Thecamonas trahens ATCC 50062]
MDEFPPLSRDPPRSSPAIHPATRSDPPWLAVAAKHGAPARNQMTGHAASETKRHTREPNSPVTDWGVTASYGASGSTTTSPPTPQGQTTSTQSTAELSSLSSFSSSSINNAQHIPPVVPPVPLASIHGSSHGTLAPARRSLPSSAGGLAAAAGGSAADRGGEQAYSAAPHTFGQGTRAELRSSDSDSDSDSYDGYSAPENPAVYTEPPLFPLSSSYSVSDSFSDSGSASAGIAGHRRGASTGAGDLSAFVRPPSPLFSSSDTEPAFELWGSARTSSPAATFNAYSARSVSVEHHSRRSASASTSTSPRSSVARAPNINPFLGTSTSRSRPSSPRRSSGTPGASPREPLGSGPPTPSGSAAPQIPWLAMPVAPLVVPPVLAATDRGPAPFGAFGAPLGSYASGADEATDLRMRAMSLSPRYAGSSAGNQMVLDQGLAPGISSASSFGLALPPSSSSNNTLRADHPPASEGTRAMSARAAFSSAGAHASTGPPGIPMLPLSARHAPHTSSVSAPGSATEHAKGVTRSTSESAATWQQLLQTNGLAPKVPPRTSPALGDEGGVGANGEATAAAAAAAAAATSAAALALSPRPVELAPRPPRIPVSNPVDAPPPLTPRAKANFKTNFLKPFREATQQGSFADALALANRAKAELTPSMHWRINLHLAGTAQKLNMVDDARELYASVHTAAPGDPQGWLAAAKMEQSLGEHDTALDLLNAGLSASPLDEALFVAALRHHEKHGSLDDARALLAMLRKQPIADCWKMVLEGALLEVRAGNLDAVRPLLAHLMDAVPWYGPVYNEALVAELGAGKLANAIAVIQRGLRENPRYGPLWFGALRVYELLYSAVLAHSKLSPLDPPYEFVRDSPIVPAPAPHLAGARANMLTTIEAALANISRELAWKVHHSAAHVLMRIGVEDEMLSHFARAALRCPPNLVWKVWVHAARMELSRSRTPAARAFVAQALACVPAKLRHVVLIEAARLEEFNFNLPKARDILHSALTPGKDGWKVHLELVLLELRAGLLDEALHALLRALAVFPSTGRLWALLIQLRAYSSFDVQKATFHAAVRQVPKSGEVWCEGARLYLNPVSPLFDLVAARKCLQYAMLFTPQYGDSLVESLLLSMLTEPRFSSLLSEGSVFSDSPQGAASVLATPWAQPPALLRACALSEPNYGMLWFQYKAKCGEHATARQVLAAAADGVAAHLDAFTRVYQLAVAGAPWQRAAYLRSKLEPHSGLSSLERLLDARSSATDSMDNWFNVIYGSDHLSI